MFLRQRESLSRAGAALEDAEVVSSCFSAFHFGRLTEPFVYIYVLDVVGTRSCCGQENYEMLTRKCTQQSIWFLMHGILSGASQKLVWKKVSSCASTRSVNVLLFFPE